MSKRSYKNKITIMALIAGLIAAVAVTSSVSFFSYIEEAIATTTTNANTKFKLEEVMRHGSSLDIIRKR